MSAAPQFDESTSRLAWALRYASMGWPVIPLTGKDPLTKHGSHDASINGDVIKQWWRQYPNANIGLATGHRFWALDIDTKSGGDETLELLELKHGRLPDTPTQITGTGGRHFLFALNGKPVSNTQGKIGPGIDTRGIGGYIVAASSIHPDTRRKYAWDGLLEIEQQAIVPAPAWLLDMLHNGKPNVEREIPLKIPYGKQHAHLVSIAGSMRFRGLGFEEIFAALKEVNRLRCEKPGKEERLKQIAQSVCRYPPGQKQKPSDHPGPQREIKLPQSTDGLSIFDAKFAEQVAVIVDLLYSESQYLPAVQKSARVGLRCKSRSPSL